jgi:hypothetical protein
MSTSYLSAVKGGDLRKAQTILSAAILLLFTVRSQGWLSRLMAVNIIVLKGKRKTGFPKRGIEQSKKLSTRLHEDPQFRNYGASCKTVCHPRMLLSGIWFFKQFKPDSRSESLRE